MIEDGEPVKKGELANQYRLTWADAAGTQSEALFTYSAGGVEYTRVDGYAIVIPQDWNLSLKVAGHEELSVVGKSNVSADGLTLAPEVTVTLNGGYVAAAKVNADPKQVTANASFTKNGTQIVDAYAKMVCDGLTDPDNWIVEEEYDWNGDGVIDDTDTYIDPEDHIVDHVKTGEGYVTVMGLKLTLSGDIAKIIQQVNAIADTSTATRFAAGGRRLQHQCQGETRLHGRQLDDGRRQDAELLLQGLHLRLESRHTDRRQPSRHPLRHRTGAGIRRRLEDRYRGVCGNRIRLAHQNVRRSGRRLHGPHRREINPEPRQQRRGNGSCRVPLLLPRYDEYADPTAAHRRALRAVPAFRSTGTERRVRRPIRLHPECRPTASRATTGSTAS